MGYIGKDLVGILNENKVVDSMTGDGSDTTLTLSRTPGSVNNVEVFIDGIYQTPDVEYTLAGDTITFTTAPVVGVTVVAVSGADSIVINPADGSITGAKIVDNAITGAKIAALSASKLTGALPALSGSGLTGLPAANFSGVLPAISGAALTGLPAANLTGALPAVSGAALTNLPGVTKSASDPLITTNPTAVGQLFLNTTSGETYVCTDATTDNNIWTNVGTGTGDVQPYHGWGSNYAYSCNGSGASQGWSNTNTIDKFAFNSSSNATDVGDSQLARRNSGGGFSTTHGYNAGGAASASVIDKYSFSVDGNATIVGNLTSGSQAETGHGCSSETYGYATGGDPAASGNQIHKYSFSTDQDATLVGVLTTTTQTDFPSMTQSSTHGYCQGGGASYVINKWTFATDGNATLVGVLNSTFGGSATSAGVSSSTYGHTCGGGAMASRSSKIEKHSFASDGDATNVASLTLQEGKNGGYGTSTQTHGYVAGGSQANGTAASGDSVNKFSFSSDVIAVDTTQNLTVARGLGGSSQY